MKIIPALVAIALLASPVMLVGSADAPAPAGPLVDAGASARVTVGREFMLDGHVEGAAPVGAAWSGPEGCAIADAGSLATTATCSVPGVHAFTLAVDVGGDVLRDSVLHAVREVATNPLLEVSGELLVAAAGASASPPVNFTFTVPEGTSLVHAKLTTVSNGPVGLADDLDLYFTGPDGSTAEGTSSARPEVVQIRFPAPGLWHVQVVGFQGDRAPWTLYVNATVATGDARFPELRIPGGVREHDGSVRLFANITDASPLEVRWETDAGSRRFDDLVGNAVSFAFQGPQLVRARVTTPQGFEVDRLVPVRERGELARPLTVVAVVDSSFSPYHFDFLGSQHPWNTDADPANDIDFTEHPAAYVAGISDLAPLQIVLPTSATTNVDTLRTAQDAAMWAGMKRSTASSAHVYWMPGTKVIAALKFGATFEASNAAHGTVSAAVAAGNLHGSCPECLFVLVQGSNDAALSWAAQQPWIDVVTNSYGAGSVVQANTLGLTRDNAYWKSPTEITREASEEGQVIVFSAGNGLANAFDVPMFTYWSSQKGPDWYVTVGAVDPDAKQTYSGAGKPVDISSIGSSYPAAGGTTANGTGTHSGTSNAAPVTAGYLAKALQKARETLGDATPGYAGGIVASGAPVACGEAVAACALADGVLTRRELEDAVYASVLPSEAGVAADTVWPSTPLTYYYQGHGVLRGRIDGAATYEAEWTRIVDHLHGEAAAYARPAGEETWFQVDSKCRQKLWGSWSGGLYRGQAIAFDPLVDPVAMSFDAWCSAAPEKPFATLVGTGLVP